MTDLRDRFGDVARVLLPADDLARFEHPARGATGRALAVVQPATPDDVREIVRRASADGIRLIPQGANSGLVGASVPPVEDPGVVLSLERLAGEPVIDAGNATAVVDAGTRLSALNAGAAPHGLHLPVDLGADPAIGGMISTNTGGSRVLRYGPMRSQVLGVELVTADADASVLGHLSGLRKDSRGLDPVHLAVGSGGAFGVVTRAVIALTPLPRTVETWWLALADHGAAVDLLGVLDSRRPGTLSAFELVSHNALARTLSADGAAPNPFGAVVPADAVLAEWSFGHAIAPDEIAADVAAAFDAGLVTDGRQVDPVAGWGLRHRVSESLRTHGVVLGHDVSTPRSALLPVRGAAAAVVAELAPRAELCEFGHVADGGLHLNVLFPRGVEPPSPELAATIRSRFDELVIAVGGSFSAEHGLGPLNAARWLATTPPAEQRLIAAIKSVVDPYRILGHPGHPYNRLA